MELNHFVIAAAMGARLGPRVAIHHGQLDSAQMAVTISNLLHRRQKFIEDLHPRDDLTKKYEKAVTRAYLTAREGYSSDRVLADPALNAKFIEACHEFGVDDTVLHLNLALIGLRKHNKLKAKSRRSVVPDLWRYAVASEIAARVMFYTHGASVDTTLAHPRLAAEFDQLAAAVTPGYRPFEYRWAALNVRKKGASVKLKPHEIERLDWSQRVRFDELRRLPSDQGVYSLFEGDTHLYVAGTENIPQSIESHQRLPRALESELWKPHPDRLSWQYVSMPGTNSDYRFGVVRPLVGRWRPVFNIPRGKHAA